MIIILIIPIFVSISAFLMYSRLSGKKELLKFDLVQFFYAFVIGPIFFVWLKSFIYFLLRQELDLRLTVGQVFTIDTIFSVFFLYIYAFLVIHSLTKTFDLRKQQDPLFDIYELSEYFHLDYSHLVMHLGVMALITTGAVFNIFFPLELMHVKSVFYSLMSLGVVVGISAFTAIWMYESPDPKFMRWMKLIYGAFFLMMVGAYFVFDPAFKMGYIVYWLIMSIFSSLVFLSLFAERYEEKKYLWQRLPFRLNPIKIKYVFKSGHNWVMEKTNGLGK